jgi:type II secretory pathway component PulC
MRAGLLALAVLAHAACGPKAATAPRAFDDDLDPRPEPATAAAPAPSRPVGDEPRAVAPPGKGLRTGTIARARLVAVLDAGPGTFLRQLEVAPRIAGDRFVGWQLVQLLDHSGPLHDVDLAPGDVLLAVNGKPVARPEQLQALWDSLRTANEVTAQLWRGDQKLELRFTVQPPVP